MQHKLTFLSRTTTDTFDLLKEAERVINDHLIPNLVSNNNYDENYREIFSLPEREVGLNIIHPEDRFLEHERSKPVQSRYPSGTYQIRIRRVEKIRKDKRVKMNETKLSFKNWLNANKMYAFGLASEKRSFVLAYCHAIEKV